MKKVILLIVLLYCGVVFSQENQSKDELKFHSISISPFSAFGTDVSSGPAINIDLALSKGKHVYSIQAMTGNEFNIWAPSDHFNQVNALYGRQISASKSIKLDWHVGAGYFDYTRDLGGHLEEKSATIGIPVMSKLRFLIGNKFSVGLQFQVNLNLEHTMFNTGLILQFNGKSKQLDN